MAKCFTVITNRNNHSIEGNGNLTLTTVLAYNYNLDWGEIGQLEINCNLVSLGCRQKYLNTCIQIYTTCILNKRAHTKTNITVWFYC